MEKIQTFTFLLLPLHFSATKHGSNEKLSKKPKLQTNLDNQQKKKKGTKIHVVLLSESLVLSG